MHLCLYCQVKINAGATIPPRHTMSRYPCRRMMKLYVATSLASFRKDYLIDAELGKHAEIAMSLIRKDKPNLTKEEKQNGLKYKPIVFGTYIGKLEDTMEDCKECSGEGVLFFESTDEENEFVVDICPCNEWEGFADDVVSFGG
jgi:hypothetical protein